MADGTWHMLSWTIMTDGSRRCIFAYADYLGQVSKEATLCSSISVPSNVGLNNIGFP